MIVLDFVLFTSRILYELLRIKKSTGAIKPMYVGPLMQRKMKYLEIHKFPFMNIFCRCTLFHDLYDVRVTPL